MTKIATDFNVLTGESTERELDAEEVAAIASILKEQSAAIAAKEAEKAKKAALLEKLGITEDEAKLLLG